MIRPQLTDPLPAMRVAYLFAFDFTRQGTEDEEVDEDSVENACVVRNDFFV